MFLHEALEIYPELTKKAIKVLTMDEVIVYLCDVEKDSLYEFLEKFDLDFDNSKIFPKNFRPEIEILDEQYYYRTDYGGWSETVSVGIFNFRNKTVYGKLTRHLHTTGETQFFFVSKKI